MSKKPNKTYHRVVIQWSDGDITAMYILWEVGLTAESMNNSLAKYNLAKRYISVDVLPGDLNRAMTLNNSDRSRTLDLLKAAGKEALAGHYNNTIRDRLSAIIKTEYGEDGKKLAEEIKSLPDRHITGGMEIWITACIDRVIADRLYQLNTQETLIEEADKHFVAAGKLTPTPNPEVTHD